MFSNGCRRRTPVIGGFFVARMEVGATASSHMVRLRFLAPLFLAATVLSTGSAGAKEPSAKDKTPVVPITVVEVADAGVETSALKESAEDEIQKLDASKLPAKQRYVISVNVAHSIGHSAGDDLVLVTAHATLRDAKKGTMVAIIEAGAQAAGTASAATQREITHLAVRNAMRRIPSVLGAN